MRRCRSAFYISVGLLLFTIVVAVPAHAQFPAFTPPPNAAPPPPPPVRKVLEDDGASAYAITDLGTLPDDTTSRVAGAAVTWNHWEPEAVGGINKRGDVALNFKRTTVGTRGGLYSAATGRITTLPAGDPKADTFLMGVADDGRVLGQTTAGTTPGLVIWNGATLTSLSAQKDENGRPRFGDITTAFAFSPNGRYAAGAIFLNGVGPTLAAWYDGALHHTDSLGQGFPQSWGVNDAGQVVGNARPAADDAHVLTTQAAFLWASGTLSGLGPIVNGVNCGARAINGSGTVAGWSDTQDVMVVHRRDVHAVLWKNGGVQDLGTLGGSSSTATDLNDAGQVVGFATAAPNGLGQPFLWQGGKMRDLSSLIPPNTGWALGGATINYGGEGFLVVNAQGQIAGTGRRDGLARAYLLTPRSLLPKK